MTNSIHHSFDIQLAQELGSIDLAILVHHFAFWIDINHRAKRNHYDGKVWTYQKLQDIALNFPYWSVKQVERLMKKMVDKKILVKGNYNKNPHDRTLWYAFHEDFESEKCISRNREIENPKSGNRNHEIGECIYSTDPIPDAKPVNTPIPPKGDVCEYLFFGEDKAVKLTQEQYDKHAKVWGTELLHQLIEMLNDYIMTGQGKKYKSHFHALRTFYRNHQEKQATSTQKYPRWSDKSQPLVPPDGNAFKAPPPPTNKQWARNMQQTFNFPEDKLLLQEDMVQIKHNGNWTRLPYDDPNFSQRFKDETEKAGLKKWRR